MTDPKRTAENVPLPGGDFRLFTTRLAYQLMMSCGLLENPVTGGTSPNPDNALRVVWDLNDAIDTDLQTALGLEYGYKDLAFVRAGKRWFNELGANREFSDGLSAGFGLRVPLLGKQLALDYAYTKLVTGLERMQVFSVEWGFN